MFNGIIPVTKARIVFAGLSIPSAGGYEVGGARFYALQYTLLYNFLIIYVILI